jgi:hypothetical protein
MPEYKRRYLSEEDGCTYCWDEANRKWVKICPVDELPYSVKRRVLEDKIDAELGIGYGGIAMDDQSGQPVETIKRGTPRNFVLDASILDMQETHEIVREDIKRNRIEFVFPDGLNQLDLFEEARALTMLDDFDTMYDLTMQMLAGRPLEINIRNYDGTKTRICLFQVVDRYMNLRGVDVIDAYPWLVTWLTEFIGAYISKKYPIPGPSQPQAQELGRKGGKKKLKGKATVSS